MVTDLIFVLPRIARMITDFFFGLFDYAAVFERAGAEVEQKGEVAAGGCQVVHGLRLVLRVEVRDGFDFDNELSIDYKSAMYSPIHMSL